MCNTTSFFSKNLESPAKDNTEEILNVIALGLTDIPYTDNFEILGCYALNKQIDNKYRRRTRDIDLSINLKTVWDYILNNITDIMNKKQDTFHFTIAKHRGFKKNSHSDSITFEVTDKRTGAVRSDIKIDMNLKEIFPDSRLLIGSLFYTDMYTMFSNKLYVASTPKIYRRVKDFYDIHSIINSEVYTGKMQFNPLANRFRNLYKIDANVSLEFFKEDYYDKLKHAYMQNSLFEDKEDFDSFFQDTVKFIQIFYMECSVR